VTSRRAVLDAVERLAYAAELLGDRRARSYGQAAWALRNLEGDLAAKLEDGSLLRVRGIGRSTAQVVADVLAGRPVTSTLADALPAGLFELRKVRGLGAKKVSKLWKVLGIETLAELEYACRENRLVELPGFGAKTQAKVLEGVAAVRAVEGMRRRDQARAILEDARATLETMAGVHRVELAGDYPRGLELCRALVLVVEADPGVALPTIDDVEIVLATGGFGWTCLRHRAHPEHVAALEARASGVDLSTLPLEDDVYAALGLATTPPERREPEVPLREAGDPERLLELADLVGALHNHTLASDGVDTLEAMREGAAARGLAYLGISEHSQTASYARGLEEDRLRAQLEAIRALPPGSCRVLAGVESDILEDGRLDYEDALLARLDFVVASVHRRHGQDAEAMTERLCEAVAHPATTVLGHPTGRLLMGRPPSDLDLDRVLDACLEHGVAIEMNAQPQRLDLGVEGLKLAKAKGVAVSLAADAHSVAALDYLAYGVAVARRAGLGPADVLNASGWPPR
jgi:DNA polymerase (family 10)